MRISRGNEVIGEWSVGQIKKRIEDNSLLPTDSYYDEELSEWLSLSDFLAKQAALKADKAMVRPCYCGSGLRFVICHGDGDQY